MASLRFRNGDAQSLKALISATSPLNLEHQEEREDDQPVLLLRLPGGVEITEPNAIAEALSMTCLYSIEYVYGRVV